jgi:hypothetical protein
MYGGSFANFTSGCVSLPVSKQAAIKTSNFLTPLYCLHILNQFADSGGYMTLSN